MFGVASGFEVGVAVDFDLAAVFYFSLSDVSMPIVQHRKWK